tara:strand:+ start:4379 stop:4669 length:291 start_codon:yes stop_codon:yes gene_type:complete
MENLEWTGGLGAIALTILILREVFAFVGKSKNGNGHVALDTNKTITRLEVEIRKVSHAINNLNQVLNLMHHELKENRKDSEETLKEVRRLREEIRK